MDLMNYRAGIEALDTPEFKKSGYSVTLDRSQSSIGVSLAYQGTMVGTRSVSMTKINTYGTSRVNKDFSEILLDVRDAAVELYDNHNKTLENADLLKALEDRLNGSAAMLVLTPGVAAKQDSKQPASVTYTHRDGEIWAVCSGCDNRPERFSRLKDADAYSRVHGKYCTG